MSTLASARGMSSSSTKVTNGSYELYGHRMESMEDDLLSPPGGPSCRPPGSPKQTKDFEVALAKSREEISRLMRANEELRKNNQMRDMHIAGEDDLQQNGVEDPRDSQIRHLNRQVTILQADLYKKEGLEQRMKEMTKEKSQVEDKLRVRVNQFELARQEMFSMRDQLTSQLEEAEIKIRQQKEEIERLAREKHANKSNLSVLATREGYDSGSPPSSSPTNGSGNHHQHIHPSMSASSMMDAQASRELEYLHKMVDALRATVIEQRNVFVKLGLAGPTGKSAVSNSVISMSNNSHNIMSVSMPPPLQNSSGSAQLTPSRSSSSPTSGGGNATSASSSDSPHNTSNNIATTNTATATSSSPTAISLHPSSSATSRSSVRQAVESCETVPALPTASLQVHSISTRGSSTRSSGDGGNSKENSPSPPTTGSGSTFRGDDGNTNHHRVISTAGNSPFSAAVVGSVENNNNVHRHLVPSGSGSPRRNRISSPDLLSAEMQGFNVNARSDVIASSNSNEYVNGAYVFHHLNGDVLGDASVFARKGGNQFGTGDNYNVVVSNQGTTAVAASPRRKSSTQSEVIDRRPPAVETVVLPPKSRTEIVTRNSSGPSHYQHQQLLQQQQLRGQSSVIRPGPFFSPHQPVTPSDAGMRLPYPQHVSVSPTPPSPSSSSSVSATVQGLRVGGIPGGSSVRPVPPSSQQQQQPQGWQNGHHNHHHLPPTPTSAANLATPMAFPPFEAEGCIVMSPPVPAVASYSNTLSNISDVHSYPRSSPSPNHHQQQQQQVITSGSSSSNSSNRLCPVCNQDFNHISMEDFQAHVLDCFDNDNGPDTLQAEMMASDYPPMPMQPSQQMGMGRIPVRLCPMCEKEFSLSATQSEFEQHVHRHFGEEAFEVLQT